MSRFKKTCKSTTDLISCIFSQNNFQGLGENKVMTNKPTENDNCNIHVMPSQITDDDITALFNGILNVVRKKFELDTDAKIINLNINQNALKKQLKEKEAECVRLKNEIIFLKSQLEKQKP